MDNWLTSLNLRQSNTRMKKQAAPLPRTKAQYQQQELKLQMNRARRDRRKAARKANHGNQFRGRK